MAKISPKSTFLLTLYGYPGSGKTYLSRQLSEVINAVHLDSERIRQELFSHPVYDLPENKKLWQIMNYLAEKFLSVGVSVIFDYNVGKSFQRHQLTSLARKHAATNLVVWQQIDPETAYSRNRRRDKRKSDDKYSVVISPDVFKSMISSMQNPTNSEDYVVVSGKHVFQTQKNAVLNKMRQLNIIDDQIAQEHLTMPGMVNLIPNAINSNHRNVIIR